MALCSAHMVQCVTRLFVHLCFYIMSPALLSKSSIQSGNPEQCMLVFTHLYHPVARITLYHFIPMYVLIVNA